VEKEPLGWDRRKGFRKLFPRVMLPFQVVERISFGHPKLEPNRLFWGDNLHVMRQLPSESIDLIYIDPPFFSGRQYRRAEAEFPLEEKRKILEQAIEDEKPVDIVYLKATDEKTRRTIGPRAVGEMEYLGKTYLGVEAYCFKRKEIRSFRVDRILEIKESKTSF
jgi:hypothetical protein